MTKVDKIIHTIEEIAKPIVEKEQLELVEVEFIEDGANWFLRIIIDKDGGIDIEDCGRISEKVSKRLDELDPIKESYFLEVCSPGAERPLRSPKDITQAIGEYVLIKTNGKDVPEELLGTLKNFENETVSLEIDKGVIDIPYQNIVKIRLAIKF